VFNPSQIRSVFEKPKGKKSAAKPGIMYHVSRRTNRGKIRAEGLRPLIKEFKEVEREPGVFLFATWAIALEWAWYHAQYVNQPIDVWEVVLPEGYKLSPDTYKDMKDINAWVGREPIPAGNLKLERTTLIPKPGDQPPAPWDKRMAADRMIDVGEGDQYWAGEGNAASGVLPVCPTKGTVCLAWRSQDVHTPNCWGTIGGAVKQGMGPQESAKSEMAEETGYH